MICQVSECQKQAVFIPVVTIKALDDPSCEVRIFYHGGISCALHKSESTIEHFFDHNGWSKISQEFKKLGKRPNLTTIRFEMETIEKVLREEDARVQAAGAKT